ncbi:MAG TPA: MlaD family protein, partial [Pyrinomonadaceae bacterium]|nr:MlaD family protein [Pyrinomonadaceae bacterium]
MPPKKKTIGLRELRVGLFVVISIFVLIFLILNASGDISPFAKKLKVKARFASADGLREGAEVRLAGVRIGKVDSVRLLPPAERADDPNKVEATLAIDEEIHGRPATELIPQDSRAQIGSPSLLGGDKIVNIVPGTAVSPPANEGDTLPSTTSTDFGALTESGNALMNQLNQLSKQFTDIAERVNRGEGTLGRFVNDEAFYNNLNATIRDT